MHNRSILLLTLVLLSAICAFAGGIQAPPSAESITGLKTWIEANVTAADVSAEIEGSIATHAADTSTHGVATVAGLLDVTNLQAAATASDALLLRLDGSRAMTGNLRLGGRWLSNDGGSLRATQSDRRGQSLGEGLRRREA